MRRGPGVLVLLVAVLGADGQRTGGLPAAQGAVAPPLPPPPPSPPASPSAPPPLPLLLSSGVEACLCSGSHPYCWATDSYCYPSSSASSGWSTTICPGNCSLAPPPP
eukprot:scaffold62549_cov38-Phaeocystis_antarctica.AAC.1